MSMYLATSTQVMYLLGWLLPWRLTCLPGALLPLLPAVLVLALPETPAWLLARSAAGHSSLDTDDTICAGGRGGRPWPPCARSEGCPTPAWWSRR